MRSSPGKGMPVTSGGMRGGKSSLFFLGWSYSSYAITAYADSFFYFFRSLLDLRFDLRSYSWQSAVHCLRLCAAFMIPTSCSFRKLWNLALRLSSLPSHPFPPAFSVSSSWEMNPRSAFDNCSQGTRGFLFYTVQFSRLISISIP